MTDADAARPYALGLALLVALRRLHPEFQWLRDGAGLDTLLGTRRVREALESGQGIDALLAGGCAGAPGDQRDRKPALLY